MCSVLSPARPSSPGPLPAHAGVVDILLVLSDWRTGSNRVLVLVHVEVQMSHDGKFGWRMYVYNYRIFDKYNREVASFAVLGDDDPDWRPRSFGYRRWGTEAGSRFPIVKLLDYAARRSELEESSNPFAMVVLAHLDTQATHEDQGERKDRKFRIVKRLRQRGWSETQVRQLFRLIDWMMELPAPLADEFWKELKQYEEKEHMPFITTPERYGRAEGRTEGLAEAIETLLEVRFQEAGSQLMPEIRLIRDAEQLAKIHRAAVSVGSPEELRKLWAGRKSDL